MKIVVHKSPVGTRWAFTVVGGNNKPIAESCTHYANRRNALEAARAIAGKKLKVEIDECS